MSFSAVGGRNEKALRDAEWVRFLYCPVADCPELLGNLGIRFGLAIPSFSFCPNISTASAHTPSVAGGRGVEVGRGIKVVIARDHRRIRRINRSVESGVGPQEAPAERHVYSIAPPVCSSQAPLGATQLDASRGDPARVAWDVPLLTELAGVLWRRFSINGALRWSLRKGGRITTRSGKAVPWGRRSPGAAPRPPCRPPAAPRRCRSGP